MAGSQPADGPGNPLDADFMSDLVPSDLLPLDAVGEWLLGLAKGTGAANARCRTAGMPGMAVTNGD